MGYNWKKRLGEELKTEKNVRDCGGMERTLAAVRQAGGKRNIRERTGFGEFLLLQLKFAGWKIWLLQAALFTAVGGLLSRIYGDSYGISRDKIPFLLCCSAVLIAMTVLPFLQRSLRCRMYEVEAAAKMSSGKLMASWIVFAGIGDGIGLSVLIFLTVRITPLGYGSAVLYLVVPFLSAAAVLFYLLGHLEWRHVLPGSVSACAVLLLLFGIFSKYYPAFYLQSFTAGWALVCLCLLVFLARQYSRLRMAYMPCGI